MIRNKEEEYIMYLEILIKDCVDFIHRNVSYPKSLHNELVTWKEVTYMVIRNETYQEALRAFKQIYNLEEDLLLPETES